MGKLYDQCRKKSSLFSAWKTVKKNGLQSQNDKSRSEIHIFKEKAHSKIDYLSRKLQQRKFVFSPQRGVPIKKQGGVGKIRPIVVAPIRNRIVQRAILETLQEHIPAVQLVLQTKSSFGGIKDKKTEDAIMAITQALSEGKHYFIRSDIGGFFTKIKRSQAKEFFTKNIKDKELLTLTLNAIETNLENEDNLGRYLNDFPIREIGVAQGSPLSPLIGNIVLKDLDDELNTAEVTCIRYIDDFIILASSQNAVEIAFNRAVAMLDKINLKAYSPSDNPQKASKGNVKKQKIEFLGCSISKGLTQPSKSARTKLLQKVRSKLKDGREEIHQSLKCGKTNDRKLRYAQTLKGIDDIITGWSHAYRFCNSQQPLNELQNKILIEIQDFIEFASKKMRTLDDSESKLRTLGITPITDIISND